MFLNERILDKEDEANETLMSAVQESLGPIECDPHE